MEATLKTLIIINGVTGAIGSACLARFCRQGKNVVGLSRRALAADQFCINGLLPPCTLLCSIGDITKQEDCDVFARKLDISQFDRILYIHAVGLYPFELDETGRIQVLHDYDGDGVDDRVHALSYTAFFAMVRALRNTGLPVTAVTFGGIADAFHPEVHQSWWKTMELVQTKMRERIIGDPRLCFIHLNISSVLCPHELLTRPFVFRDTDAQPQFWLTPDEVAQEVIRLDTIDRPALSVTELYHKSTYYSETYFEDSTFTPRKIAELGINVQKKP